MPAAAFSANAACGRDTQLKIWIGSTVNGDQMPSRQERHVGQRADGDERRGFADRARQRQDQSGQDARKGRRQHLMPDRLPLGGAERVRRLAQRLGHRAQRFARGR